MDATFATVLTGTNCHAERDALDEAVERRFARLTIEQRTDYGYCYDGNRTKPENLGWRFRQMHGDLSPLAIEIGLHDDAIAATYHEAAASEHYYRYEKDWGWE